MTVFVNVNTYVLASPRASNSPCPSVDIRTVRSKTVFLGRQQLYALLSTGSVDSTGSDFGITPVFRVQLKCRDTLVADVSAFSV